VALQTLKSILSKMGSVLIAYSGGVDSTFLCKVAKDVLGDNVLAVTAVSPTYTKSELAQSKSLAKSMKVKHLIIHTNEFKDPNFVKNPKNRCYYCKSELLKELIKIAKKKNISYVIDASNIDDLSDFRPGAIAKKELKVRSPLQEAKMTKAEIRKLSKSYKLPTWNAPSCACLASRFPYGEIITPEKLKQIELAESYIRCLLVKTHNHASLRNNIRVRHHGTIARIELDNPSLLWKNDIINDISRYFKKIGFTYVTVDIDGFRSGSMNEIL